VTGNRISNIQTFVFKTPIAQADFGSAEINISNNDISQYGVLMDNTGY
jgi:hypothetical protein